MKRLIIPAILALFAMPLAGCGGGHGSSAPAVTAGRSGSARLSVVWPESPQGRYIPESSNTIKVEFYLPQDFNSNGTIKTNPTTGQPVSALKLQWFDRDYLAPTATEPLRTVTKVITGLPVKGSMVTRPYQTQPVTVGQVLVHATAFSGRTGANFTVIPYTFTTGSDTLDTTMPANPQGNVTNENTATFTPGSSTPLAGTKNMLTADVLIDIDPVVTADFHVSPKSTITHIDIGTNAINFGLRLKTGDGYLLVAVPRDAQNRIVLVKPSSVQWSRSSGIGIRFRQGTGVVNTVSGLLVGAIADIAGTGEISITETDSGFVTPPVAFSVDLSGYGAFGSVGIPGAGQDLDGSGIIVGDGNDIYLSGVSGAGFGDFGLALTTSFGSERPIATRSTPIESVNAIRSSNIYEYNGVNITKTLRPTSNSFGSAATFTTPPSALTVQSLSVDTDGNVYAFGHFLSAPINEYRVYKYGPGGGAELQWTTVPTTDSSGNAISPPSGEARVDDLGNVYFLSIGLFPDIKVRKLTPNTVPPHSGTVDGNYSVLLQPSDTFAVAGAGYLYTMHQTDNFLFGKLDSRTIVLRAYDAAGTFQMELFNDSKVPTSYDYVSADANPNPPPLHETKTQNTTQPILLAGFDASGHVYVVLGRDQNPPNDIIDTDSNGDNIPDDEARWGYSVLATSDGRSPGVGRWKAVSVLGAKGKTGSQATRKADKH